jgi:hypothetical protein
MSALIDAPGVGQLRRRYMMSRIQSVISGSNFYDLDGFYGAIFNLSRSYVETLPINPMLDSETPDEWDAIHSIDASYRERIVALAAAIPLAGTLPGIKQAAEALTGVECEVYEAWKSIDGGTGLVGSTLTWANMETTYPLWENLEGKQWGVLAGNPSIAGYIGVASRAEIVVRPLKRYDTATTVGQNEIVQDELFVRRVLDVLRPASTVISVDTSGVLTSTPIPIASVQADSNYWEIVAKVTPNPIIKSGVVDPYPLTASQVRAGESWTSSRTIGVPAFTYSQGASWDYASEASMTQAYAFTVDDPDDIETSGGDRLSDVVDTLNYEISYGTLGPNAFSSERGLADPLSVQGGRITAGGIMGSAVYSGTREEVQGR